MLALGCSPPADVAIAYTVGRPDIYDPALERGELVKRPAGDGYPGGWAWRSAAEAEAYAATIPDGVTRRVYQLCLPSGWRADVGRRRGGVHRLVSPARVVQVGAPCNGSRDAARAARSGHDA